MTLRLRQHHRAHTARMECRVPVDLRAQLEGPAAAEHPSLNMTLNLCLEEGLAARRERQRAMRDTDPARDRFKPDPDDPLTPAQMTALVNQIDREWRKGPPAPELPADLTDQERAELGLPPVEQSKGNQGTEDPVRPASDRQVGGDVGSGS